MHTKKEKELIKLYLQGEKEAISVLFDRNRRRILNYINMMVKDRDLAEDILQETFIKVFRVLDEGKYSEDGKFVSWVMRIAHNQVIDHFRKTKQINTITEADAGYSLLSSHHFAQHSVEDNMISDQIAHDLRKLVGHLPDDQREVVQMRYYNEMSFQQIADQTGVSINTALGRMRYALINLRKMIKENQISMR